MKFRTTAFIVLAVGAAAVADTSITKPPDLGNYWWPLGNNGNTPVYSDSFLAPDGPDLVPARLGTWLDDQGSGGTNLRFEVWGDNNGPDASNVLSSTGTISPSTSGLTYIEAPVDNGELLTPGVRYWFVATAVGESGSGYFQTGAHTQNSVYQDDGTFWYSNDPNGINFDGQNLTPEMAFSVTFGGRGCYADFAEDGELNLFDFLQYVNEFNAGDDHADCDGDGEFTLFDFLCYTNAFNAGC